MILYYTYGWNPFKRKEDFQKDACEKIEISNRVHLKEDREKIIENWFYNLKREGLGLQKEYFQTFFVFDQKGNQVDEFSICLKTDYEICDKKEENES